jgi:selenide,water dikinase
MINTIDFITPPVDDPYWFGQIAAANAISDIYSMGGRPVTALNVVMFPAKHLDMGILKEILHGGHDKVTEAGASLVGGHSVDDEEPKYGLCVNGVVHPDRIITNAGAKPGDALILTKPIGTGVLFNAVRTGKMSYRDIEKEVLPAVATLNGPTLETALEFELHACTDVTGFGICGHLLEVVLASKVRAILEYSNLQIYPGALDMYKKGETTGSNPENRRMTNDHVEIKASLSKTEEEMLYDPQTSGGLLLSVPASQADGLLSALSKAGISSAALIGEIVEGPPGISVV